MVMMQMASESAARTINRGASSVSKKLNTMNAAKKTKDKSDASSTTTKETRPYKEGRRFRPVSERMAKPVSPRMMKVLELMAKPTAVCLVIYEQDSQNSSAAVIDADGGQEEVRWDAVHSCRLRGFLDWMKGPEMGNVASVLYSINKDGREALRTGRG